MFNFFGKKENTDNTNVFIDKVFISAQGKANACLQLAIDQPDTLFIAWFSDTARKFRALFAENGVDESRVMEYRFVHAAQLQNTQPVFLEHYPLQAKEIEFSLTHNLEACKVYSSLDEPLFKHFGSDKMIPLIKMMGMKENESIEHSYVTQSIHKGQQKIADKVTTEQLANSQEEWMKKNMAE